MTKIVQIWYCILNKDMLKYMLENYTKGGVNLEDKLNTDINKDIEEGGAAVSNELTPADTEPRREDADTKTVQRLYEPADESSEDEAASEVAEAEEDEAASEAAEAEEDEAANEVAEAEEDEAASEAAEAEEDEAASEVAEAEEDEYEFVIPASWGLEIGSEVIEDEDTAECEPAVTDDEEEADLMLVEDADDILVTEGEAEDDPAFAQEDGELIEEPAPIKAEPCPAAPFKEERYDPEKPRKIDFIFDFLELFVFTLVGVLLVTTFFVRHSVVDGNSMLNTLHHGDTLIISDLFYEPAQNDIIVIESTELGKAIVKRVIAVGGQKVMVTPTAIFVDGKELKEDSYVYTDGMEYIYDLRRCEKLRDNPTFRLIPGSHYEFVVPEGELFVMGDHRSDSKDSRDLGTLPVDAVLGKVLWRVLPFDSFGAVE